MSHLEITESGAREQDKAVSQQRTEEFRRAAVEKFQSRGSRSVEEVARVLGVSSWSLYQWSKRYGNAGGMKDNRRPGDRSVEEKLKAVIEYEGLAGDKQGEYLRREGLHSDHAYSGEIGMDSEANRQSNRRKSAIREVGAKRRWDFVHNLRGVWFASSIIISWFF